MTEDRIVTRPGAASDAHPLATLLGTIVAEGDKTAIPCPFEPDAFAEWFLTGAHCLSCIVAEDHDGGLVGFQALERYHDLPVGTADIATFVAASARGRGVGRRLFAATTAHSHAIGIASLRAVIRAANDGAVGYYRACGLKPADEEYRATAGSIVLIGRI